MLRGKRGRNMSEHKNLEGLGGWLVLVGLGIVFSPLVVMGTIFPTYSGIFANGMWDLITTSSSEAYNPAFATLLVGEIVINCALVVAWIYAGYLFFSKRKLFPNLYIGILIFSIVFILVDAAAVAALFPKVPIFDPATTKQFLRSLVVALVWIPYMLVSKRVKATFVS